MAKAKTKKKRNALNIREIKPKDIETLSYQPQSVKKRNPGRTIALARVVSSNITEIGKGEFLPKKDTLGRLFDQVGFSYAGGTTAMKSFVFRESLTQYLDAKQIQKLRDKHLLGCEAKKVISIQVKQKFPEKKLQLIAEKLDGEFLALGGVWFGNCSAYFAVPDHSARYKYFDQIFRILGEYDETKPETKLNPSATPLGDLTLDQLKEIMKDDNFFDK